MGAVECLGLFTGHKGAGVRKPEGGAGESQPGALKTTCQNVPLGHAKLTIEI